MKKLNAFLVSVLSAAALNAAVIEQVIVRQQWPWSTDIKVEYRISGVDSATPVDIAVQAYNGEAELPLPDTAIRGKRYCIVEDGVGTLIIDPVAAFGTEKIALANFKIKLSVATSSEMSKEVLYKIFDLTEVSVTDVTRGALLNGEYGAFETNFGKIGAGYKTSLSDVVIWTGVTNYPGSKTTKLVMRKVPAGTYKSHGVFPGENVTVADRFIDYPISKDFYIGVFELTQAQWRNIGAPTGSTNNYKYRPVWVGDERPVETVNFAYMLYGHSAQEGRTPLTPGSEGANCLFRALQNKFYAKGISVPFTLPTVVQWLIAARAGTTSYYNDGLEKPETPAKNGQMDVLGRYAGNGDVEGSTSVVGSYRPNAFGLYDTLGNVREFCCDYWSSCSSLNGLSITALDSDATGTLNHQYSTNFCGTDYSASGEGPADSAQWNATSYAQLGTDSKIDSSQWKGLIGVRVCFAVAP